MTSLLSTMLLAATLLAADGKTGDANRLAYLDVLNPYYPSRDFPKLITPQWVGEEGVEAVVVLGIDDMRGHPKWEAYLRPILERLKKIDGRAPLSIMTCKIDPAEPHLQRWLKEGVSLECHTVDHPCPLLGKFDLAKAKSTYDRCVDQMFAVPGSRPVAFRMPCCDSLNTVSPRFFAEIFNKTTENGNFLAIDTSVFCLLTPNDPELPRALVLEKDGRDRFRKYLPSDRTFVNYIEDYPYPYVIGNLCWEFPCMVPSDWSAQHRHKPNNPQTVEDWKAALDAVVIKRGVFCLVFHPHGWIRPEQVIALIDHAVKKHGKKVKFLTFRQANDRLNKHLLNGHPLRNDKGQDNGVLIYDVNLDGYQDVVIGDRVRLWSPRERRWLARALGNRVEPPLARGRLGKRWRDINGDGKPELIVADGTHRAVFTFDGKTRGWKKLPFALPAGTTIVDAQGRDRGLRFVDFNGDGKLDVIFSNEQRYSLHLFESMTKGWSRQVLAGDRSQGQHEIPMIVRGKTNNGAWFADRHLWVQNEDTGRMKDLIDRRSFNELLKTVVPRPKSPEMSLRSIKTRPGFRVELVAAEPLVMDPVAFEWGPDGKLWVVEMADYPLGLDDKGKPGGRVRFLEDTNGDGKYDKSTLFLDGISFPSDVFPWRKGVLIAAAPDVFYAEDTDGDGRADLRQVLYAGFKQGNQQHRVNGFRFGLDNWIYLANGDSGGRVKSLKTGRVVDLGARDLRIRPDQGLIDLQSGRTQHGRCRDDWGNWFGANNATPGWHYALADHYLRRNPHVAAPDARSELTSNRFVYARSRPLSHWEGYRPPPAGEPGKITSACGHAVYRDELFGPGFGASASGNASYSCNLFMSEVVHNLVHRMVLSPSGTTFKARRAAGEGRSEFLASGDSWFRPTTLKTGPGGALWIADMYRLVIEHPEWIDDKAEKKLFLRAGHDKGRIYRVYPIGKQPRPIPRLDRLDTPGLVSALDSPSGWQRDMVQQMLIWRGDESAAGLLEKLAATSRRPLARLHALCTLDGLGELKQGVLRKALADPHPGVRRHAVRLCEPFLRAAPNRRRETPPTKALAEALLKLADDRDPGVRLQLAYTLGEWRDPRAGRVLAKFALNAGGDAYLLAAVMSSVPHHVEPMLSVFLSRRDLAGEWPVKLLVVAVATKNQTAVARLLEQVAGPRTTLPDKTRYAYVAAMLDGLARRKLSLELYRQQAGERLRAALARLDDVIDEARAAASNSKTPLESRLLATKLLARDLRHRAKDADALLTLLSPRNPLQLQQAAVAGVARLNDRKAAQGMFRSWKTHTPRLRGAILDALLSHAGLVEVLLDQIETNTVRRGELDAARRDRLLKFPSLAVRRRARKVLADKGVTGASRKALLAKYRTVVRAGGDATRGAVAFKRLCANCHKLGAVGHAVGPDLAALTDRSAEAILVAVLDPNRAVEAKFQNYTAVLNSGRIFTGMLTAESGSSITLLEPQGKKRQIARADLAKLESSGKSLMPEGIEKDFAPQDLADVIAYINGLVLQPRKKPTGNEPGKNR